jgi:HD superfamily phosphodiesterase
MEKKFYAHSLEGKPPNEWHPLEEHLRNVTELARCSAESFGAGELAYLAGLWHDIGETSWNQPNDRKEVVLFMNKYGLGCHPR